MMPYPLSRDLDDVLNHLLHNANDRRLVLAGMARNTAAEYWPHTPPATMPRRTRRPRRRLPTRRSWRENWQFAYGTPNPAVAGSPYSASDYNVAAVNDILYLLSGQPLISVFVQPNANFTLALTAAQASFSKVEGAGTTMRNTITINSSRIMGYWLCFFGYDSTSHNSDAELNNLLDGTSGTFNSSHYIASQQTFTGTWAAASPSVIPYFYTGLATGAHTIDPAWRSDWSAAAGTTTLTVYSKTNYGGVAHITYEM